MRRPVRSRPDTQGARLLPATALLALAATLGGCSGLGVFLDDTHSATSHVNRPLGNSETMREVEGSAVPIQPLVAEPGNVWPGPVQPEPTLEDLARTAPRTFSAEDGVTPPSIANVPALTIPPIPHHMQPRPGEDGSVLDGPIGVPTTGSPGVASPQGRVTPTARGPQVQTRVPTGIPGANMPAASSGIVVPNGNGTSTVIAPDGTISTIPTPPTPK